VSIILSVEATPSTVEVSVLFPLFIKVFVVVGGIIGDKSSGADATPFTVEVKSLPVSDNCTFVTI
jgi:hypothetical protein